MSGAIAIPRQSCARRLTPIIPTSPLQRALKELPAWITGMRREQSPGRQRVLQVEEDSVQGGMARYNPLAHWSTEQVWQYVREHEPVFRATRPEEA